ncbi:MAG: hypothetical protein ACOCYV_01515 [Planctomycetota bacterium]
MDLHLGIFDSVVFLAFLGLAFQGHAVAAGAVLAVAFLCAAWRIRQRERRAQSVIDHLCGERSRRAGTN